MIRRYIRLLLAYLLIILGIPFLILGFLFGIIAVLIYVLVVVIAPQGSHDTLAKTDAIRRLDGQEIEKE